MGITLEWRQAGNAIAVVNISGRSSIMDGSIVQQTVRRLIREGNRQFVFNLKDVVYLDSLGLGQLIAAYLSVRDQGGDVRLVSPTPTVRELLTSTRLDSVLQVCENEDEAVSALQKNPAS